MTTTDQAASACPFLRGAITIPRDGTPLAPSPLIGELRDENAATPLEYADGHVGWMVTRHTEARDILADPRYSQQPMRLPLGKGYPQSDSVDIDDDAHESLRLSNLLGLDGEQHLRIRRAVLGRFSIKQVRGRREAVQAIVADQLRILLEHGSPANITEVYTEPISARVHRLVLGIPEEMFDGFYRLFVGTSTTQEKFDFIREAFALKRGLLEGGAERTEDVFGDLLAAEADGSLSTHEIEGIALVLMTSGRDSVAYLIATATTALLTHPSQAELLRREPEVMTTAIEEFMRFGAMFITLFPRTATETIEYDGFTVEKGQTVSVSPVGANRDERHFADPTEFDLTRDAGGHLGFGHGPHGCIGQQLARIEIREGVSQLFEALPTLALVHADQLEPQQFASDVPTYAAGAVVVSW
ncbi:cytochrome P450 [Frondihabitans australicus]|uniref:Cytochrome P450 n=1 Tax=Frondihabitans australicus TaxID=386892 RepID=A0A495ICF4_9MICO|nr:cytochrome P450 [Frondihabitans australicus]RKR73599.1 cytochrome P450 [Frondihabitans australicus]